MKKILFILFGAALIAAIAFVPGFTGQYPPTYRYVTSVTQSSTTAPVDTFQYSSMPATPTWRYVSTGVYNMRCTHCFGTAAKKIKPVLMPTAKNTLWSVVWLSGDSLRLTITDTTGAVKNALMTDTGFDITIYP